MTISQLREYLEDDYYSILEDRGIDYMESDQVGFKDNLFWQSFVKDEYQLSDDEIAQELGFRDFADYITQKLREEGITTPKWVEDWTRERLAEENLPTQDVEYVETCTEYGTVAVSNKLGSTIL